MKREIQRQPAGLQAIDVGDLADVKTWLQGRSGEYGLAWLLAHADDGVIWGRVEDGRLITSHEAAQQDAVASRVCPPLRVETLQQARLFASGGELLLWRTGEGSWRARLIRNVYEGESTQWEEAFDEPQLLWGTHGRHLPLGFTLLEDGAQGLRHAIPVRLPVDAGGALAPPHLLVRHYLNKGGLARVVASRLLDLQQEGSK